MDYFCVLNSNKELFIIMVGGWNDYICSKQYFGGKHGRCHGEYYGNLIRSVVVYNVLKNKLVFHENVKFNLQILSTLVCKKKQKKATKKHGNLDLYNISKYNIM